MNFMKYFLILIMFFWLVVLKLNKSTVLDLTKLKILILKSEKQKSSLISKYGPPSFESPFKKI